MTSTALANFLYLAFFFFPRFFSFLFFYNFLFFSSSFSSLVAAFFGTPCDVVKARMMNQPTDKFGKGKQASFFISHLSHSCPDHTCPRGGEVTYSYSSTYFISLKLNQIYIRVRLKAFFKQNKILEFSPSPLANVCILEAANNPPSSLTDCCLVVLRKNGKEREEKGSEFDPFLPTNYCCML